MRTRFVVASRAVLCGKRQATWPSGRMSTAPAGVMPYRPGHSGLVRGYVLEDRVLGQEVEEVLAVN